jgi:glutamate dehydrogenase
VLIDEQGRYMRQLVARGRLNRGIEFLPDDDELSARKQAGSGLTAPELAVLLAYHKMELYDQVLDSDVPEDAYIATSLQRYFPTRLHEQFPAALQTHPLKREIIATHVINSMVNRVGPTFVHRLHEETGAGAPEIVRAYLATRQIFDLVSTWLANEALDNIVAESTQNKIVLASVRLIERGTVWLLRHRDALRDIDATIRRFTPGIGAVTAGIEGWLAPHERATLDAETARWVEQGVPQELAQRVARMDAQVSGLDIVEVSAETGTAVETVASIYFGVGGLLDLGWMSHQIAVLPTDSHWQALARVAMRNDLSSLARDLTRSVLTAGASAGDAGKQIEHWQAQQAAQLARCQQVLADVKPAPVVDMAMLSVLLRETRSLV